jgi:hypothetical protein
MYKVTATYRGGAQRHRIITCARMPLHKVARDMRKLYPSASYITVEPLNPAREAALRGGTCLGART